MPMSEPTGAEAAGTISVTTAPTEAGTYHLYIAGIHVPGYVSATDAAGTVASAIDTAIKANDDLPVTSTVTDTTVNLTCKWKGVSGNSIDLRDNYYGAVGGEEMPT